jgi:broad specificity phosphatase PhoE
VPTILLVRHGQASFGTADYDELSRTGGEQSDAVARELAARRLDVHVIASGSLRRQRQTAAPVAAALSREVAVDARWNEYEMDQILAAHSGSQARASATADSRPVSSAEFQDLLEGALAAWLAAGDDSPAPESWPAFATRVQAALRELAEELPSGSTGLVFTSGGVVAALCAALLELPATALLPFNRVSVNAGITKLVSGRRGISLVSFNEHRHLEQEGGSLVTYR